MTSFLIAILFIGRGVGNGIVWHCDVMRIAAAIHHIRIVSRRQVIVRYIYIYNVSQ